jgi:hypothetical protein
LHPLQDGHPCHEALLEVKKIAREKELSEKKSPYSKRTFRKEVNAIARRAGKNSDIKSSRKLSSASRASTEKRKINTRKWPVQKRLSLVTQTPLMSPLTSWNLIKGFLARKDMRSVQSDLTPGVIKPTSKILIQMMVAKCLLKSAVKNLKRSLIPWTQNPLRKSIRTFGDSLISYETRMEDNRTDPEDEYLMVPMTEQHIDDALLAVTNQIFPYCALETQKQWMSKYATKPYKMGAKQFVTLMSQINNYIPFFLNAAVLLKHTKEELLNILEFAVLPQWRKAFDLRDYLPTSDDKARFISECERVKQNKTPSARECDGSHSVQKLPR